jgi:hypothetical protein
MERAMQKVHNVILELAALSFLVACSSGYNTNNGFDNSDLYPAKGDFTKGKGVYLKNPLEDLM